MLALVETKRKENGLLKECGPKSSWAVEKSFFFQIVLKDFDSKQRVLKHFQTKFELMSN
jgi:hypothetical protein